MIPTLIFGVLTQNVSVRWEIWGWGMSDDGVGRRRTVAGDGGPVMQMRGLMAAVLRGQQAAD